MLARAQSGPATCGKYLAGCQAQIMLLKLPADIRSHALREIAQGLLAAIIGALIFLNLPANASAFLQCLVLGFLLFGCFLALMRPRWYLRAQWLLNNVTPLPATITLRTIEFEESKQLWAEINISEQAQRAAMTAHRTWKVAVLPTASGLIANINRPQNGDVYFDPRPQGPIVIKIDKLILWPAPTSLDE
jgi:hypothetical protein